MAKGLRNINVTIKNHVLSVSKEVLMMGKTKNQKITWAIVTNGWIFPEFEDGIELKGDHGEFSNGHRDETGKHYIVHNKNSHTHLYPYTIKVTNGKTTLSLDPGIGNEGGM
jgi:hypothetical protein